MALLVFVLACASPSASDGGDSGVFFGSDEVAQPRHPDPTYTAEEAAAALLAGVQNGVPMPVPIIDTWHEMLSHGDDGCPGGGWVGGGLSMYLPGGCVAASGYWYSGVGGVGAGWEDSDGDGDGDHYFMLMKTDGAMADPEGNVFGFGGYLSTDITGDPMHGGDYEAEVLGTYVYPGSDVPWLAAGTSTGSYLSGRMTTPDDWTLLGNGGFTVGGVAVGMTDFAIQGECGAMPSGTLGIRDDLGYWYDLRYDATTCDGCGEVWFDGHTDLGHACADVSGVFTQAMHDFAVLTLSPTEGPGAP